MNGIVASSAGLAFDRRCLDGRTVLVTGASSGLGRSAAIALSGRGARVILMGRDADRLAETGERLLGEGHVTVDAPIDDPDAFADLVKATAKTHRALDGVFHAAGTYVAMPARLTKAKHVDAMFDASVGGAYGLARAVSQKGVMNDGGSVVFMSSVAARRGNPGTIAYAGAKAAVLGLVPALAIELGARSIRVNAIVAGATETEMHMKTVANLPDSVVEGSARKHILGFGSPDDVANAVIFLLCDASRWITGTSLVVDGGYLAL